MTISATPGTHRSIAAKTDQVNVGDQDSTSAKEVLAL
jgi:hypothetical protein